MYEIIREYFYVAFHSFILEETESILTNVHEQNVSGQLGQYLNAIKDRYGLGAYYVDPEYDRKQGGFVKTIRINGERIEIRPDLIVHSRGKVKPDNIIVIEMKKTSTRAAGRRRRENDRERLIAMTSPADGTMVWGADGVTQPEDVCGYELGLFIELDLRSRTYLIEEFQSGQSIGELRQRF